MKQRLLLTAFVLLAAVAGRADVEINETNFPDDTFRNCVSVFDLNADDKLTDSEINKVTAINVYNKGIKNLKGIEFFTELTSFLCWENE